MRFKTSAGSDSLFWEDRLVDAGNCDTALHHYIMDCRGGGRFFHGAYLGSRVQLLRGNPSN